MPFRYPKTVIHINHHNVFIPEAAQRVSLFRIPGGHGIVRSDTTQERRTKQKKDGILKRVAAGVTSIAGITAAIATITTSTAAVLGVVVHSKNAQLGQAHAQASSQAQQIQQQTRQIRQLQQQKAPPVPSASPTTTSTSPNAQVTNVSHYLSDKLPTVDLSGLDTGQVVIAAKPYANSISFNCDGGGNGGAPDEAFDVAGSATFNAEVGIPDDTQDVTGFIATITFSNESGQRIGQPVQVTLGHPISKTLNIKGVTQLGMTCNGRNRQTNQGVNGFRVGLGDAGVS